ncbi:MAG: hypothetical protein K6G08_09735 [Prevotella sp.]|nr:hypothetical protein [Prevotella sp.]
MSYYKRPELMLLDSDACQAFKKEKNIEQFFFHILNTEASVYYSGDCEDADAENTKKDREALRNILTGWIRRDYLAERNMSVYYISRTFYKALVKSFPTLVNLFDEKGLMESLHEDCCLILSDTTFMLWRDPADDGSYYVLVIVNGSVAFFSSYQFDDTDVNNTHSLSFMYLDDFSNDDRTYIESIYAFLLFKKYGNVDIETVAARKTLRKSQILGEKVNNFMGIDVQVLDSRWFTTICRDEGFLVSGHFRLQPCKDEQGQWTRRLIYINPYAKHGYHRMAPIVNTEDNK